MDYGGCLSSALLVLYPSLVYLRYGSHTQGLAVTLVFTPTRLNACTVLTLLADDFDHGGTLNSTDELENLLVAAEHTGPTRTNPNADLDLRWGGPDWDLLPNTPVPFGQAAAPARLI